jgi:uncharacterized protein YuzB (UPF0349 family)
LRTVRILIEDISSQEIDTQGPLEMPFEEEICALLEFLNGARGKVGRERNVVREILEDDNSVFILEQHCVSFCVGVQAHATYISINRKPIFHEKRRQTFVEGDDVIRCDVFMSLLLPHDVL